jgi:hypothetical protein
MSEELGEELDEEPGERGRRKIAGDEERGVANSLLLLAAPLNSVLFLLSA